MRCVLVVLSLYWYFFLCFCELVRWVFFYYVVFVIELIEGWFNFIVYWEYFLFYLYNFFILFINMGFCIMILFKVCKGRKFVR